MKRILTTASLLWVAATAGAQSTVAAPAPLTPESAYVAPGKYTNAFFGFSFLFPADAQVSGPGQLRGNGRKVLCAITFGLDGQRPGFTTVLLSANASQNASPEEARKAASPRGDALTKRLTIGGKEFWKSDSQRKTAEGKVRELNYVASLNGYLLEFVVISYDGKLAGQLERSIESLKFFDPALARQISGPESRPLQTRRSIQELETGKVVGNKYTHDSLGFAYYFPLGWSVADTATQTKMQDAGHQAVYGQNPAAAREHEAGQQCIRVLLWVSKSPETVGTAGIAPRIVVFVTEPACLAGFRFPVSLDDKEGVRRAAQELMGAFSGLPFVGGGMKTAKAYSVQGRLMLDLSGAVGPAASSPDKDVTTSASLIITETNGYLVGWIFGSGSASGLAEMKRSTIEFLNAPTSQPTPPK